MILHELLQELHEYHPIGYMRSDTDVAIHCTFTIESAITAQTNFVKRGILISVNHPPTVA